MAVRQEFLVSTSGQMSVPAAVRRRWGLGRGGRVVVMDLGDAVVILPAGARQQLIDQALPAEEHRRLVAELDDPDLATT
ncbi:MAG: hypothetical protein QOF60_1079 [Actinomycetota bacterium]|jgi:AbrB family looped-hinge helix DNA binding protein|nr:hypothetical protein [Actinomycetota bacterium]